MKNDSPRTRWNRAPGVGTIACCQSQRFAHRFPLERLIMPALSNLARVPLPTSLLAPQAALTIAARTCLLEGPAFDGDGNLFFSDIIGNQIYRMTLTGSLSIFR